MKQIAIYFTNTDTTPFAMQRPKDPERIEALLKGAGAKYEYTVFNVIDGAFIDDPADFDAVILGGSPADIRDGDEWIKNLLSDIRRLAAAGLPMIGLCFGHQAILSALGGRVEDTGFWIFGAADIRVQKRPEWMLPVADTIRLHAANHAQVVELPQGFEVLGGSEECPNALIVRGDRVFSTQYHPEIDDVFMADLVEELAEQLGPEVTQNARQSIKTPPQGALFGQWLRNFIELERPDR